MLEQQTIQGNVANPALTDRDKSQIIEQHFAITERLKRRAKAVRIVAGQDPFEEPGFTPKPRTPKVQRIAPTWLVALTQHRFTAMDFAATFGSALMYDHWLVGGVIVLVGIGAKHVLIRHLQGYHA